MISPQGRIPRRYNRDGMSFRHQSNIHSPYVHLVGPDGPGRRLNPVSLPLPACPVHRDARRPMRAFATCADVARRGALGQGRAGQRGRIRMLWVTGGAGFIGSNLVASLNEVGRTDIVVNDALGDAGKWRNLGKRQLADVVPPAELIGWLDRRKLDAVVHLGAISDTTATDGDLVLATNFRLSLKLLDWCTATRTPFIYASSAATYADGAEGFDDDWSAGALQRLKPMNLYGFSKHLFDLVVADRFATGAKLPPQWAGLKFFNVFGPNEYHKGEMASLIARRFDEAAAGKSVPLFKAHRAGVADGDQKRDFIHVDDAVAVLRWLLDTPSRSEERRVGKECRSRWAP